MVSALRVAARSMSDFDDDLQLDNWLNLTLSQPHDPVACGEMLMRAANGDTFAISDRPEITFPWRRTIATLQRYVASYVACYCLALFDQDSVGAVRTICSVDLHGDVIAENDWVMCTAAGEHDQATRLMRIIEMVEMVTATDSILFARGESKATPDVDVDRGGQLEMTADAFEVPGEQCAFCVADVSLIPVHITRQPISGNYVCHIMF